MAEAIGLDGEALGRCLDEGTHAETVAAMIEEARGQGVDSTPTLVVNGEVIGWEGWDHLKAAIDEALGRG